MSKKAFSLIELLIYVSIFAVVAGLMTSILVTILKVSQKESASIETSEQLSFVMQTVSRLIRESSNIETASADSLKLRMKDPAKDPTCLYRENQIIKLAEGPDSPNNNDNCTPTASNLTSSKVIADKLEFSKITNYPGHDVVSIDIQLTYNSNNPQSQTTRNLKSAIARVSAATFDDNLIPGSDAKYDLGFSPNTRWKDANFSGNLLVGGNVGIGTVNPGVLLQVEKSGGAVASFPTLGAASGNLALIGNAGGWGMYLGLDDSGPGWIQQMRNDSAVAYNLVLQPVGGNVGIGTTGPGAKLDVNGSLYVRERDNADDISEIRMFSGTNLETHFYTYQDGRFGIHKYGTGSANGEVFSILNGGNVGIGTTNPGSLLHLYKSSDIVVSGLRIEGWNAALTGGRQWELRTPSTASAAPDGYFTIRDNGASANRLTIDTSGNVGIGTAGPSEKLDVVGNATISGTIRGATYGFGGMYNIQNCSAYGNPFTGGCSCPSGFPARNINKIFFFF